MRLNYYPTYTQSKTYQELDTLIGEKARLKVGHNTYAYRVEGGLDIVYHRTTVVSLTPNGEIMLNSGGWHTSTTKERLNWFLPASSRCRVYQKNWEWYVDVRGTHLKFYDGFIISKEA
jgi:hypothetical protein